MSLFDLDDDGSSSVSSRESEHAQPSALASPPVPAPSLSAEEIRARMGLPGRFTVTAEDAAKAAQRQREALQRRLAAHGGGGGAKDNATAQPSGSKFGQSIAAALQLRKEDQEQLLLARIRQQREEDANTPALVEKDLDVGIFVTPAYKQILRKHYKVAADKNLALKAGVVDDDGAPATTQQTTSSDDDADDDVEDALDAYLKQFAPPAVVSPSTTTADFYTDSMRQAVREGAHSSQRADGLPASGEGSGTPPSVNEQLPTETADVAPPSLEELQNLLGLSHPAPNDVPPPVAESSDTPASPTTTAAARTTPNTLTVNAAVADASRAHLETVFRAREARRRKRADDAFISGCAARCDARILRCVRLER